MSFLLGFQLDAKHAAHKSNGKNVIFSSYDFSMISDMKVTSFSEYKIIEIVIYYITHK